MASPLLSFSRRRWLGLTVTVFLALVAVILTAGVSLSLRNDSFLSGWVLLGSMIVLALYKLRKKLPYPPLLRSSTWLQIHIYLGALSVLIFLLHIHFRVPDGPLETTLAGLYLAVAGSGVVGIVLTRFIPPRLATRGEEVLFERIPVLTRELRIKAEELVVECGQSTPASILPGFYTRELADFFHGPRHFLHHLLQRGPFHGLTSKLGHLDRYFSDEERRTAAELAAVIEVKDKLDYHHAMQSTLKGWLFVHVPLTYALIILALVHTLLAHAFSVGIR